MHQSAGGSRIADQPAGAVDRHDHDHEPVLGQVLTTSIVLSTLELRNRARDFIEIPDEERPGAVSRDQPSRFASNQERRDLLIAKAEHRVFIVGVPDRDDAGSPGRRDQASVRGKRYDLEFAVRIAEADRGLTSRQVHDSPLVVRADRDATTGDSERRYHAQVVRHDHRHAALRRCETQIVHPLGSRRESPSPG